MQLKCSKCQKVISISEEKIPRDKEKAMIKCPGCQQVLVFTVPQSLRKMVPQAEKTMITEGPARQKVNLPKLVHTSENIDFQLKVGKNIIGRDADISIPGDPYISRRHCLVEVTEKSGGYFCIMTDDGSISDSGEPSTNGTFHNGARLTRYDKVYLDPDDKIRLGRTDFVFKNE